MVGTCALCLTKNCELRERHYMPAALYPLFPLACPERRGDGCRKNSYHVDTVCGVLPSLSAFLCGGTMRKIAILATLLTAALVAQDKKRVAVMDFDYAAVQSSSDGIFGSGVDVGKSISNLLVDRLVAGGAYSVIERKAIDKIVTEQNFSNSDRADPATAARIGKLLSVNAIIVGSVSQFGVRIRPAMWEAVAPTRFPADSGWEA
jgi:Curli production assembly/transport component CsgG